MTLCIWNKMLLQQPDTYERPLCYNGHWKCILPSQKNQRNCCIFNMLQTPISQLIWHQNRCSLCTGGIFFFFLSAREVNENIITLSKSIIASSLCQVLLCSALFHRNCWGALPPPIHLAPFKNWLQEGSYCTRLVSCMLQTGSSRKIQDEFISLQGQLIKTKMM